MRLAAHIVHGIAGPLLPSLWQRLTGMHAPPSLYVAVTASAHGL
jgi:hypothetical protein